MAMRNRIGGIGRGIGSGTGRDRGRGILIDGSGQEVMRGGEMMRDIPGGIGSAATRLIRGGDDTPGIEIVILEGDKFKLSQWTNSLVE